MDPFSMMMMLNGGGNLLSNLFTNPSMPYQNASNAYLPWAQKGAAALNPFMQAGGYQTADVITINHLTENYEAIRAKFLAEHTHSEDEIRFFVDGKGLFRVGNRILR